MDFIENPADRGAELAGKYDPQEPIDVSALLQGAGRRVQQLQRRISKAMLEITSEIDKVREHVSLSRLTNFLASEYGINHADTRTYLKIRDALGDRQTVIAEHGLAFIFGDEPGPVEPAPRSEAHRHTLY